MFGFSSFSRSSGGNSSSRNYAQALPLPLADVERGLAQFTALPAGPSRSSATLRIPDSHFKSISDLLRHYEHHKRVHDWHVRPRIYAILRNVNRLDCMPIFVSGGLLDIELPFDLRRLPQELGNHRTSFLQFQDHVLTDARSLESGEDGKHMYFQHTADHHFFARQDLGSGGFGHVDLVWSRLSYMQYARKRFKRSRQAEALRSFAQEISALKRLCHRHLVKIVGSYTDQDSFAFLMTPVADGNLLHYLQQVKGSSLPSLRNFYGCLSNAVAYLHHQQVYHMDIKPENILIKGSEVYLADFGTAHDWSKRERSTTWAAAPRTPRYMAPEISKDPHAPRNWSTDIWSLGIVFLEMTTVLRGKTLRSFRQYLPEHGTKHQFVYDNAPATSAWLENLRRSEQGHEYDNIPLEWVKDMTQLDPLNRPRASDLFRQILGSSSAQRFCGFCCDDPESVRDQAVPLYDHVQRNGSMPDYDDKAEDAMVSSYLRQISGGKRQDAKSSSIEAWLDRSTSEMPSFGDEELAEVTEATGPFFDIEDDSNYSESGHASVATSITQRSSASGLPSRLANLNFGQNSGSEQIEAVTDENDEGPDFDVVSDSTASISSHITIVPGGAQGSLDSITEDEEETARNSIDKARVRTARPYSWSKPSIEDLLPPKESIQPQKPYGKSPTVRFDITGSNKVEISGKSVAEKLDKLKIAMPNKAQTPVPDPLVQMKKSGKPSERSLDPPHPHQNPGTSSAGLMASMKKSTASILTKHNVTKHNEHALSAPAPILQIELPKETKTPRISAKNYMDSIWEVESSAATSAMSGTTRSKIGGMPLITAWNDAQYNYLGYYAKLGKSAAVRLLLEKHCNPGTVAKPRPSPLINAVRGGSEKHNKCVRALLQYGADVNPRTSGKTPLQYAVAHQYFKGYSNLIFMLLSAGADPNVKDQKSGDVALLSILLGGYDPLPTHRRDALAMLLHNGADVNVTPSGTLNQPIHLAIRRKDPWAVGMLLEKGASVTKANGAGQTPLHLAVNGWYSSNTLSDDQVDVIKHLLNHGAQVDERIGSNESTALHMAIIRGYITMVQLLLDIYDADPELEDKEGLNATKVASNTLEINKISKDTYDTIVWYIRAAIDKRKRQRQK